MYTHPQSPESDLVSVKEAFVGLLLLAPSVLILFEVHAEHTPIVGQ